MDVIGEDIKQLEKDVENIQCNPIMTFIKDFLNVLKTLYFIVSNQKFNL